MNAQSTIFKDMLFAILMAFLFLFILLLTIINPVARKNDGVIESAGDIVVEIYWDDKRLVDVDVFAEAPNDLPVGFPRKRGRIFSLLRDDLGHDEDPSGRNYEFMFGRGLVDGRYRFSILYYKSEEQPARPINVRVVVSIRSGANTIIHRMSGDFELTFPGEERGTFYFILKDRRVIDSGMENPSTRLFWDNFGGNEFQ